MNQLREPDVNGAPLLFQAATTDSCFQAVTEVSEDKQTMCAPFHRVGYGTWFDARILRAVQTGVTQRQHFGQRGPTSYAKCPRKFVGLERRGRGEVAL